MNITAFVVFIATFGYKIYKETCILIAYAHTGSGAFVKLIQAIQLLVKKRNVMHMHHLY